MNKLIAAFMLLFVMLSFISMVVEFGSGGIAATSLTASVDEDDVTWLVTSTDGFLTADFLYRGDEVVAYTGLTATSFTGVVRGVRGTSGVTHDSGARVYSPEASALNSGLGFNVASTEAASGEFNAFQIAKQFFFTTVPRAIMWDYSFFEGPLVYVRYIMAAVTIGFLIVMALMFINTVFGLFRP